MKTEIEKVPKVNLTATLQNVIKSLDIQNFHPEAIL